jgi:proton-dependent oligopeptide transporter, POT family
MAQSNGGGVGSSVAKMPSSMGYILTNETFERFSYYGLVAILPIVMTRYLLDSAGNATPMTDDSAKEYIHLFTAAVYFFPFVGTLLCDLWLGTFRTVVTFSALYCLGFLALMVDSTAVGLTVGLSIIAVCCGIIKPCVTANVGDQFDSRNQHLLSKAYNWFYLSINVGSFVSMFIAQRILDGAGRRVVFGLFLVVMAAATIAFYLGKSRFVRVPVRGGEFFRQTFGREGLSIMGRLSILFVFVAVFWSLYYQTMSAWVLQAKSMNLHWLGRTWKESEMTAVNPVLILVMIPIFNLWIYPAMDKVFRMTPLRKMGIGFFVAAVSFLVSAWIEARITAGGAPSIGWQVLGYLMITASEVMVSIPVIEFSYTQAPPRMKSLAQTINLVSTTLGNLFTAWVNNFIQAEDGTRRYLLGADYYLFFFWVMAGAAVIYIGVAMAYKEKTYVREAA